jgi:small neutral amino acid transporter SnatA (MarC family)
MDTVRSDTLFGPIQIFAFFFVMLGPLRMLGPFVQRTRGIDDATVKQIAWWTFVVALVGVVTGGLLGRAMLANWKVSIPAMVLTAGIVFFMVALRQLLEQYEPAHAPPPEALPASPIAAACSIVYPIVLTPYGIAAVIALLGASGGTTRTAVILSLLVVVMVLNLLAMWFARRILVGFSMLVLQVLGAVLAVLQVALSVQIILIGLRSLGVLAG